MRSRTSFALGPLLAALAGGLVLAANPAGPVLDVRSFGAKGDGQTLDAQAINAAIEAASGAGGGTVYLPAGTYPSYSIRLKSRITLELGPGATLLAAAPAPERGRYDPPEPNEHDLSQDFGHSHWKNSLIWGIALEDVSIVGPGRIDGAGLTSRGPGARWSRKAGGPAAQHGDRSGGGGRSGSGSAAPWTARATRRSPSSCAATSGCGTSRS
jgi:polygalacturonase